MKKRRCAVCGKIDTSDKFGDGITIPKTTCLDCKKLALENTESKTVMNIVRTVRG